MASKKSPAGMAIKAYIKRHGITQQAFADRVGVSQSAVQQWIIGRTRPTPKLARVIIRETGGEITAQKLFPELDLQGI